MFTAHAWDLADAQLGESERSQRAASLEEGFLSKPFDLEVLVNTVDGVVQDSVGSALSISTWRAQILDR